MTRSKKTEISTEEKVIILNAINHSKKNNIANTDTETVKTNSFRKLMEKLLLNIEEGKYED